MSTTNPTTTAQHPAAQSPSAAPAPAVKPKRPLGKALLPRPLAVKNAALADSLDRSLSAIQSATPATVSWSAPEVIDAACALIDAAASTIPPPVRSDAQQQDHGAGLLSAAAQNGTAAAHGSVSANATAPATPPYDGTIRDAEGFRSWVAERPESRARVAWYLAEVARTGKLSAPMEAAGIGVGILGCLEQRHPIIRAALCLVRTTAGRRMVGKAHEAVESVLDAPDDQQIQLKAASIAMQYGPKAASGESGEGGDGSGGVQIVINMGAPPTSGGQAIPMEQVKGKALFVQSR